MKRTWTDDQLIEAVKNNTTMGRVITELGLSPQAHTNYHNVNKVIRELGIDISHMWGEKNSIWKKIAKESRV